MSEERDARADAAAAKARAKSLRPWYKKKRFLIPMAFVVVVVIAAAAGGGDDTETTDAPGVRSESQNESNPPAADVTLGTCEVEPLIKHPIVSGTINNNSGKPSNYTIHVDFLQGERRVAQGVALETEVQPGQDTDWETTGDKQVEGSVECKVTRVERFAS